MERVGHPAPLYVKHRVSSLFRSSNGSSLVLTFVMAQIRFVLASLPSARAAVS